jgi:glycosyltransferase involved in cell wall biosynthesis
MNRPPLFSVVIPTRDRPELLPIAVRSVLGQTISDLEIIVVDDGGEGAIELPDDPRVRIFKLASQAGPSGARNAGLESARGQYVTFLDDDDLYLPMRLELSRRALARAPVALCFSEERWADGRRRIRRLILDGVVADSILDGPLPNVGAVAVRRDLVCSFDETYGPTEDAEWWLRQTQAVTVATEQEVGHVINRGGTRIRQYSPRRLETNKALLADHYAYFELHRRAAAYRWSRVAHLALEQGDLRVALQAARHSLRARPTIRGVKASVQIAVDWIRTRARRTKSVLSS